MIEKHWKRITVKFLTAQTISLFGSSLVQYAIIWYITLATSSGAMMTFATICGYVPQIIISLFAGVWLNRYDRKKLMMLSDGAIAVSTLAIALAFLSGHKNVGLLFAVLIVRSAGTGIQTPAVNAFLPLIVPNQHLMRINGINSTLSSLTVFLAPAASGLMLSITSIEATFFVDVVTAVIGICMLLTVPSPVTRDKRTGSISQLEGIREGFSYLKAHKMIKGLLIYMMVVAVLISPSAFLTPLLVSRTFGPEVWKLTASEMVFSFGAAAGGLFMAVWGGFKDRRRTIFAATVFYGFMMVGIGLAPIFWVYLAFNGLIGISMPCYNTPVNVFIQENVESGMQGRVFSLVQLAGGTALPLGTLIFGPLADSFPVQAILIVNGLFLVLTAAVQLKQKS